MNSPVSPPLSPPTPTDVDETRDLLAHSQRLREMLAQTHTRIRTLEDQLRNSEALASFGHFKISTESKFSLSRSAAQLLGLNAPEAPKKLDEAFRFAAPEDRTALLAECVKLTSGGAPVDMEAMFELGNAGRRWLRVVLRRSTTPQGTEYYGLIIDVTQSRLDAIRRELALEISRKLLSDEDSTGAYESVLLRVCNGLGWDVGSLWLAEADGSLACIAVASLDDPQLDAIVLAQRNRHLRKGSGMVGEVWKTCESAWAESVPEDHRFADREAAIKSGINSAYTFPIVLDQGSSAAKPIGVLQFLSRAGRRYDAQLPAMSGLIGAMLAQRVRRERWVSRIRDVAEKDALTGFASRFALVEHLWTRTATTEGEPFAILSFDLNRFKLINDALGHDAGDLVLKTMAARWARTLPETARLARLSSDEFVAYVPGTAEDAERHLLALREAAAQPLSVNGYEFSLTASTGKAMFPHDANDPERLLREADVRRQQAKRATHGSRVTAVRDSEASLTMIQTEHDLRQAFDRGELVVHYQPIFGMGDSTVPVGAEALIRWQHPERGLLTPGAFLPVAEQAGLMREVSRRVLAQVTQDIALADGALPEKFRFNVNLSALDFRDLKLFKDLGSMLREAGVAPQRYRFEVTESTLMEDVDNAERVMGLLTDYGVEFAIDDFGTGYSSLAQLARLPVHELKIDTTFTQSVETPRGKTIVRAVLDMASRLEMPVTAEGIESRTQAVTLTAFGCRKGQGFLFGHPSDFAGLLKLL